MPKTFADLVALMDRLRAPEGCPWDREQTYTTLAPMLLEEAYEAFEAVEDASAGRPAGLRDELGDMLFQIVFYAQVAKERGDFSIDDVTDKVHSKMVRRHPHVFGDAQAENATEVLRNWEAIKAEEKRAAGDAGGSKDASILDGFVILKRASRPRVRRSIEQRSMIWNRCGWKRKPGLESGVPSLKWKSPTSDSRLETPDFTNQSFIWIERRILANAFWKAPESLCGATVNMKKRSPLRSWVVNSATFSDRPVASLMLLKLVESQ